MSSNWRSKLGRPSWLRNVCDGYFGFLVFSRVAYLCVYLAKNLKRAHVTRHTRRSHISPSWPSRATGQSVKLRTFMCLLVSSMLASNPTSGFYCKCRNKAISVIHLGLCPRTLGKCKGNIHFVLFASPANIWWLSCWSQKYASSRLTFEKVLSSITRQTVCSLPTWGRSASEYKATPVHVSFGALHALLSSRALRLCPSKSRHLNP